MRVRLHKYKWLLSAPLVVNSFILLFGASFTLTITVWQAFAASGYEAVKAGMSVVSAEFSNPRAWQKISAGLYAGGFAALTVLRNEAAAAVAIGVDMGKRVASVLEGWCCNSAPTEKVGGPIPSSEEMEAISEEAGDTPNTPSSPHVGAAAVGHAPSSWRGRWAAMLLLGGCIGVFVLLACVFVHSTRVASLCVLAAQSLVESLASLLGGPTPGAHTQCPPPSVHSALSTLNATDDCIVCASGPTASRFGPGGRGHALAVCGLSALGMLIQYTRHTRGSHAHSAHLPRVCIQHSL